MVSHVGSSLRQLDGILCNSHVVSVPLSSEGVTVVDETLSSVDGHLLSADKVAWSVVLLFLQGHSWAVGEDGSLSQLLLLQKHGEGVLTRVLLVDLFDLNLAIREVVTENIVLVTSINGLVLPENVEVEDLSVVVEEGLKSFVWSSTFQLHFDVVLELSLVRWGLLEVDHGSGVSEEILRVALGLSESDSLVGVESSGELVAVNNSEDSGVDIEVDANVEVSPGVVFALIIRQRELVSLEEYSLWHSGVLNLGLEDVDGVVIEEVVDSALARSEVLVGVLHDGLDEVGVKDQDL